VFAFHKASAFASNTDFPPCRGGLAINIYY
jgi:hypothetical protein